MTPKFCGSEEIPPKVLPNFPQYSPPPQKKIKKISRQASIGAEGEILESYELFPMFWTFIEIAQGKSKNICNYRKGKTEEKQ